MATKGLVLCVEDEPDIGLLLERTLDSLPVEVILMRDGLEALDMMAERQPDLIVLDLMLPRISGWEFLERVRANEDWRSIPVVILSVRSGSDDRRRGKDLEVAHYMTKPFVPRHLQQVVTELLGLEDSDA
jgi:CheY-like chemotaxis protein